MKKFLSIIAFLVLSFIAYAQTQQGIVKTRGRMVNGQLVPGQRLTGATVTLNFGNPLVSGSNGAFSFNVPTSKAFSLVSAKKQGYTLADPEYTRRSFKYSASNPFYVVLEDEAQRQADINAATRKLRRTLTAQLQAREDEIEALKEQNKLTEKEYQERLQQLYDNQSNSEKLVKEMAERYASTDYDLLDEFNRQVQQYIEEGELLKADSMIQSKGSLDKRIEEYHQVVAANKVEREKLEQSEAGAAKTYEDLSKDLFNKHTIAMQQYEWDDALMYMKQRADLDTTNLYSVWEYAEFSYNQNKFTESLRYWLICLRSSQANDDLQTCLSIIFNLCNVYFKLHEYRDCETFYKMLLQIYEPLFKEEPQKYQENIANAQMNLGSTYIFMGEYDSARKYLEQALENFNQVFRRYPEEHRESLAKTQNNLGLLYTYSGDFGNSEKFYMQALENYRQLYKQDPEKYRPELARTQGNIGLLYHDSKAYSQSLNYYQQAMENYEQLFKQNPDAYRVDLANTQNSLGVLFKNLGDKEKSEGYHLSALENREYLFKLYPDTYRGDLGTSKYNIGNLYKDCMEYAKAEEYYKSALEKFAELVSEQQESYRSLLTSAQINLGDLYILLRDYINAIKYHESGLKNLNLFSKNEPNKYRGDIATLQFKLAVSYGNVKDYPNYEKYLRLASANLEDLFIQDSNAFKGLYQSTNYALVTLLIGKKEYQDALVIINKTIKLIPAEANLYDLKGTIYLALNQNKEALGMWKKVQELNPDFLYNYPNGTELSNGLKKLGLIE